MKVQLVVVQGKPEGKTIPLAGPRFKIGRGEGCHLKPSHELVSREHAEFEVGVDSVTIRDLGSRNGTDVNGKPLVANQPMKLRNGDLVKVGPLTFAVSIEGAPVAASAPNGPMKKPRSLDDVDHDEIDSWLVSDAAHEPPDRPSGVYGGDTITIETYQEGSKERSAIKPPDPRATVTRPPEPKAPAAKAPAAKAPAPAPEPEETVAEEEIAPYAEEVEDDGIEDLSRAEEAEAPEEMMDESNPFYVKKKKTEAAPAAGKGGPQQDSSDKANDILRKMMDRRRATKS